MKCENHYVVYFKFIETPFTTKFNKKVKLITQRTWSFFCFIILSQISKYTFSEFKGSFISVIRWYQIISLQPFSSLFSSIFFNKLHPNPLLYLPYQHIEVNSMVLLEEDNSCCSWKKLLRSQDRCWLIYISSPLFCLIFIARFNIEFRSCLKLVFNWLRRFLAYKFLLQQNFDSQDLLWSFLSEKTQFFMPSFFFIQISHFYFLLSLRFIAPKCLISQLRSSFEFKEKNQKSFWHK